MDIDKNETILLPFKDGIRIINKSSFLKFKGARIFLNRFLNLAEIFSLVNFCICLLDNKNRIIYLNSEFATIYGFKDANSAISQPFYKNITYRDTNEKNLICDRFSINEEQFIYNTKNNVTNLITLKYPWYDLKSNSLIIRGTFCICGAFGKHKISTILEWLVAQHLFMPSSIIDINAIHDISKLFGLSKREQESLKLILEYKSSKEIAKLLKISFRTVEYHTNNIKKKIGAKSKTEIPAIIASLKQSGLMPCNIE